MLGLKKALTKSSRRVSPAPITTSPFLQKKITQNKALPLPKQRPADRNFYQDLQGVLRRTSNKSLEQAGST
jgi:hypothetical protein